MMKLHNLMDELEKVIDDPDERSHVLEGLLGYILCTTMVGQQPYALILAFLYCFQILQDSILRVLKISCDQILQEAAVVPPYLAFATRQNPGFWEYVKVNANDLSVEGITATEYLKFKEMIVDENW